MDSVGHINSVVSGVRQKLLFSNLLWNWLQYNLHNFISDLHIHSLFTKGYVLVTLTCVAMATHFNWTSLQSKIKKCSLFCLSIMIFMEFMVIYRKKYLPFRLSTNSVETSTVWLLDTLYFYVAFDNLFCLRAAVKQKSLFLHEMRILYSLIHLWVHFLYLKVWQPLFRCTRAIFEKSGHVPN